MTSKSKFRPSPALVVSCVALFMALAGTAFALPKASVGTQQIVNGSVRTADLHRNAVRSGKIANATIKAADLGTDSVESDEIRADAVGAEEIAEDAVTSTEIAEDAVASPEVAPESLTAADLAASSVGSSEVADQSLTDSDLGANSVGSSEIQTGAVRAAELGPIVKASNSTPIAGGGNASVTANCPGGTAVISGGVHSGLYQVHVGGSYRTANGWHVDAHSNAGGDTTVTAYAYCLAAGSSN